MHLYRVRNEILVRKHDVEQEGKKNNASGQYGDNDVSTVVDKPDMKSAG